MITGDTKIKMVSVTIEELLCRLENELPCTFTRSNIGILTGGAVHPRTLANRDSLGTGPPRFRLKKKIIYERTSFLEWFRAELKPMAASKEIRTDSKDG